MSLNVLGVLSRTAQLWGTLANGATMDSDDAAALLISYNAMKRAMFGTLIGPRLGTFQLTGTTGQAENGGEYVIPGGAGFTLAAPANPKPGARFGVVDGGLAWTSYPLTVTHSGVLMNGGAGNVSIATSGQNTRWWFRGDTGNWVPEADSASVTASIEFPDPIIAYLPYMLCVAAAAQFSADLTPEVQAANLEGREVIARMYGRRGRANPEGPIGLAQPQAAQGG